MAIIEGMAEEKMALAPATTIVDRARMTDMKRLCLLVYISTLNGGVTYLLPIGQFQGCNGSSGPSKST
jgi:hypothetical protein